MRWLAKKFFWSFVISATLLVVTSFVPSLREQQQKTFRLIYLYVGSFKNPDMKVQLQQELVKMAQQHQQQQEGSYEFRHGEEINAQEMNPEQLQRALANAATEEESASLSESVTEQLQENKELVVQEMAQQALPEDDLVVIQGQTFRKSPDNIYIVNGERVFYKKRSPADDEDDDVKKK